MIHDSSDGMRFDGPFLLDKDGKPLDGIVPIKLAGLSWVDGRPAIRFEITGEPVFRPRRRLPRIPFRKLLLRA